MGAIIFPYLDAYLLVLFRILRAAVGSNLLNALISLACYSRGIRITYSIFSLLIFYVWRFKIPKVYMRIYLYIPFNFGDLLSIHFLFIMSSVKIDFVKSINNFYCNALIVFILDRFE